jgi:hypothetical protein
MSLKSPEVVLRTALAGSTAVTSIIGTRIFPLLAPASATLPLVTWRRVGINREQTLKAPMGVPRVSVDYVVYGTSYEEARTVADAMRRVLDGYAGQADNVVVRHVSLENEADDFVTLEGADLPPVYSVTQTYDVSWQES